jgi:hypothetical protein
MVNTDNALNPISHRWFRASFIQFFFLGCSKLLMVISPNQRYLPNSDGNAAIQNGKLGKIGLTEDGGEGLCMGGAL